MKELTPYQQKFVNLGKDMLLREHILFMVLETRVGKTPISLKIAEQISENILFVTNKKFSKDVKKEIEEFGINVNVEVSTDHNLTLKKFEYRADRIVIVDECHDFGGIGSKKEKGGRKAPSSRGMALKEIVGDNMVIFMSATPTPEGFAMIYFIFWISKYSPFAKYKDIYAFHRVYGIQNLKKINERDQERYNNADIKRIKPLVKNFFLCGTQEEAGFKFKEIREVKKYVKMSDFCKQIYNEIRTKRIYKDGVIYAKAETAVKKRNKLSQICGGTLIDDNGVYHLIDTSKVDYINREYRNNKIAVYYRYKSEREMLMRFLDREVTEDNNYFLQGNDSVFISQFRSGRQGINLVVADFMVFFNIDDSYASFLQSKQRIQNLYRDKEPVVYLLMTGLGIDAQILKNVKEKQYYTEAWYDKTI